MNYLKAACKILCFLVIFLAVTSQTQGREWRKANIDPVCFETRQTKFGMFYAPSKGKVAAVKLVHLYGYVSCDIRIPTTWSFWGCGYHGGLIDHVDVVMTTENNHIIFPPMEFNRFHHIAGKWTKIPGYNSFSPEIVLSAFSSPYDVRAGERLRLWYGEDLADYTESDNGGKVCCDVYMLYV